MINHSPCNAPFHNRFKLKVKTVNNVLSFTISSSPKREHSRVTDTVMMLVCVCKQAAISGGLYTPLWRDPLSLSLSLIHTQAADVLWCDPVSLSLSLAHMHANTHTHTHKRCAKLHICTVNSFHLETHSFSLTWLLQHYCGQHYCWQGLEFSLNCHFFHLWVNQINLILWWLHKNSNHAMLKNLDYYTFLALFIIHQA